MRFSSLTLVLLAVIAHASMPGRQEGRLTSLNAQELERPVPLEVDVPEMKVAENPTRAAEYLGRGRKASQPEVEKGPPEDYARPTGQLGRITHECPKELLQLVRTILAQPIFDSYKVLGLPHSATDEEIRAAYFKVCNPGV